MSTQQDHKVRVVALENLVAMCEYASGGGTRFWVDKVSRSRVHVTCSQAMWSEKIGTAIFPCYPSHWDGDEQNPRVVLDVLRVTGNAYDLMGDFWMPLVSCPELSRLSPDSNEWHTADQWDRILHPKRVVGSLGSDGYLGAEELGIDPDQIEAVNAWLQRGDGIACYENSDISSMNAGHRKYASFGSPDAMIESSLPPKRMPDIGDEINQRYQLVGVYRGDLLQVVEDCTKV